MTKFCAKTSKALSLFTITLTLFIFLFVPMKSVYTTLGIPTEILERYFTAVCILLLVGAAILWLYSEYFACWSKPSPKRSATLPPHQTAPVWLIPVIIILAIVALVRALLGIEKPFDNDEIALANYLTRGIPLASVFADGTHPVSTYLGVLFAKCFGTSMLTVRLPAVLFGAGFFVLLGRFCKKYSHPIATLFIFGHLASSAIFIWYLHSTRGYAAMIFLCFVQFSIAYETLVGQSPMTRGKWILLAVSELLIPFTHGFGTLFAILLPISVALWIVLNDKTLSGKARTEAFTFGSALLIPLPLHVFLLGSMFLGELTAGTKYVGMTADSIVYKENMATALSTAIGASHLISHKLLLLIVGFTLLILLKRRALKTDFTFVAFAVFMGFVQLQRSLLSTYITGRFFLGVLPLFLIWLLNAIELGWSSRAKGWVFALAFIPSILFPILDGRKDVFHLNHDEYYDFIKTARANLKGVSPSCIEFTHQGEDPAENEAVVARGFYFPDKGKNNAPCNQKYLMHFSWAWPQETPAGPVSKTGNFPAPSDKKYNLLLNDGNGRYLASIQ